MVKKQYVGLALFGAVTAGLAWQNGIALAGLTDADAQKIARDFFENTGPGSLPGPGSVLRGPLIAKWKAAGPAERAQAVREMALYAKSLVSSPAFETTYNAWIKDRYHAVDHGGKVDPPANMAGMPSAAGIDQMKNMAIVSITQIYANYPPAMLKPGFDKDMTRWQSQPNKAKLVARGNQIAPLFR
jgi:hypothetical protein